MTDGGEEVYPHPDSLPVAPLPPHESTGTRRLNITVFAPGAISFAGFFFFYAPPAANQQLTEML